MSSAATSSDAFALHGVPNALQSLRRVRVGSGNPAKIQAVGEALAAFVPNVRVDGVEVESGVPEQPLGFDEILRGARNRALAALRRGDCDLAAGIEDGLVTLPGVEGLDGSDGFAGLASPVVNLGCAWLTDGRRESFGLTSAFGYPDDCAKRAQKEREPIGGLFDELWQAREVAAVDGAPSGRGIGNIGKLTLGVLTRAEYARHAVVCALVRYLHPDLYPAEATGKRDASVGDAPVSA